jgi:hypothetical protein
MADNLPPTAESAQNVLWGILFLAKGLVKEIMAIQALDARISKSIWT